LAAFGWAAYRDALMFGVMHGVWCVGSGWALMMLPMLLPEGHNLAMVIVTFIMLSEHFEHPRIPRWRMGFRGKLFRIVIAQTQIRLKRVLGFLN
jgi:predicted metal-binding membrane protein